MLPFFEQLIKDIPQFFQLIGLKVPPWIWYVIGILALIATVVYVTLSSISYVMTFLKNSKDQLTQLRDPEQKQKRINRQAFAEHIEQEIRRLSLKEDWKDKRFAELEAEVEVDSQLHFLGFTPRTYFLNRNKSSLTRSGTRREKSLSKALARSRDRLILVEGEPGSGKSVALRHLVQITAEKAKKSRSTASIIPIYVNLKELNRTDEVPIDRNLIESFILKSLKRINDRDVDHFLDEEFHVGMKNGTWFFLFDSFDELPEVLSSTESDTIIKSYGDAIADFLQGMNRCRGVVASRLFNGPKYFDWSRFTILQLSEKRRLQLIRKSDLSTKLVDEFIGELGNARAEITSMASNPLFLSLLCEHMKSGQPFPQNAHAVFETYVDNRLKRDNIRLEQRFKIDTVQIRKVAESIAFCMATDAGLGLNPTRDRLLQTLKDYNIGIDENFATVLDALEFIKLARSEESVQPIQSRSFTFAHRRFQEYFATCVVLREPSLVTPQQLLTNARWRETAVVMCQTQPLDKLEPLLKEAVLQLDNFCTTIQNLIDDSLEYVKKEENKQSQLLSEDFPWHNGLYHLLGLLQDGFISRLADLQPENLMTQIRTKVGKLLLTATEFHLLDDRKSALEVAGTAPEPVLTYMLKSAFNGKSQWLKEVAYRQIASLTTITPDIAKGIRTTLLGLTTNRRIYREKYAVKAHISRLRQPYAKNFHSILKLLLRLPIINFFGHVVLLSYFLLMYNRIATAFSFPFPKSGGMLLIFTLIAASYLLDILSVISSDEFKTFYSLMTWYLRGIFVLLLVIACFNSFVSRTDTFFILLILLSINTFILQPFALFAATLGLFASWFLWSFPFFPSIWPFIAFYIKRNVILNFFNPKNITDFFNSIFEWTIVLALMGLLAGGFVKITSLISQSLGPIIIIISLILMLLILSFLIIKETIYWYKWLINHQKLISCDELWGILTKYQLLDFYKVKTLMIVRERKLLAATPLNQATLKEILFEIEAYMKENESKKSAFSIIKILITRSKKSSQNTVVDKIIRTANAQFLDEVHKLREALLHEAEN